MIHKVEVTFIKSYLEVRVRLEFQINPFCMMAIMLSAISVRGPVNQMREEN